MNLLVSVPELTYLLYHSLIVTETNTCSFPIDRSSAIFWVPHLHFCVLAVVCGACKLIIQ